MAGSIDAHEWLVKRLSILGTQKYIPQAGGAVR